ncbi:uncharacterized protein LOC135946422 [Cloeon dipterum]|uniref:uncharacterized protein LOC135946422 n=1 Tax=Cloeon dipterum TaxID=197152 RepID=UPI00321FA96D
MKIKTTSNMRPSATFRKLPAIDIDGKVAEYVQHEDLVYFNKVISLGHVDRMRDGYRGGNLLHHCIWARKGKAARFLINNVPLLQHGVDNRGQTPLMYAVTFFQQDTELLRIMSNVEPELLNKQDTDLGNTALLLAVLKDCTSDGGLETIKLLIDAGASSDIRDSRGYSAFYFAYKCCSEKLMNMLLEVGAKVEPMDIINVDITLRSWPAVENILKIQPSLINAEYKDCTLLMKLIRGGMQPQVKQLLQLGALPDLGEGALVEAVRCGNQEMCRLLLQRGTNTEMFANALVSAAIRSNKKAIEEMVFNLNAVKRFSHFHYDPESHPQTVALHNRRSPDLLKHIANHRHLRKDSLGVTFLIHHRSIFEIFDMQIEFLEDLALHLMPLAIPLVDQSESFYEAPNCDLLEVMMEANYSAVSPDDSYVSPLTLLLCNNRDDLNTPQRIELFEKLLKYFLKNGVSVEQKILCIPDEPPSVTILTEDLQVPDALLIAFLSKHVGAVLRLLPFWPHPPPLLCLAATHFPDSAHRHMESIKMLDVLLSFGLPHGSEYYAALEEIVNEAEETSSCTAFKKYSENPISLQQLCILKIRSSCAENENLPEALSTLPIPKGLRDRVQFNLREDSITYEETKFSLI